MGAEPHVRPEGERHGGGSDQPSPAGGNDGLDIRSILEQAIADEFGATEPVPAKAAKTKTPKAKKASKPATPSLQR